MKARLLAIGLVMFAAPTFAETVIDLNVLAAETGLSVRQVGMVLGAHSAYSEFRASYPIIRRQFAERVGQERFEALLAAMKAHDEGHQVAAQVARESQAGS